MVTLDDALDYHRRGISIIPVRQGTKKPACRWKSYQSTRPDERTVRRWFSGDGMELAVILGEVSGDLVCRDFDCMASYENWAAEHPELSQMLPTVETGRPGRHVYVKSDVGEIRRASKTGGGIIEYDDGELRGADCYCLAPPSRHPNGSTYRWLVPLGAEIPTVELRSAGFLPRNREAHSPQTTCIGGAVSSVDARGTTNAMDTPGTTNAMDTVSSLNAAPALLREVEQAIEQTLPTDFKQRHRMLFRFARKLKRIPALTEAPANSLKSWVQQWHQRALPNIRTKAFEETWFDFAESWRKVEFPEGEGPLAMVFSRAVEAELPAVAMQYEQLKLRLLVALCRELQRESGDAPFFLSVRIAGELLEVDPGTASRWLRGLQVDEILKLIKRGTVKEGKASRFRYLAEL